MFILPSNSGFSFFSWLYRMRQSEHNRSPYSTIRIGASSKSSVAFTVQYGEMKLGHLTVERL